MAAVPVSGQGMGAFYNGAQGVPGSATPFASPSASYNFWSAPPSQSAAPSSSLMPTGSANSFAYPFVDAGLPPYMSASTGCPYQVYPDSLGSQYSGNSVPQSFY
uniref:Uncharacterized protein n=1 Tax=Hemiselmis andersenii TaxID=464988 RepID=A0A6U2IVU4_HEMAN|mmetsp:Transcript_7778/g.17855  ORF Transcript_7778/g.17855 Transcript_7778/m.17855 type:complete len:104 (-) Transcript_7778:268-579(-)|eukprot:CAMPEP_0172012550 /NCGR_PEP_ID=MMETSP1041-20130122/8902_1 /TAXON_ID=464988 /ORGANISM="Hemiselmis andersenii, Strain CCMP439" /LENGTH=103 /DNA_ID=CAMNT_0012667143 /DNA_START=117 /DNA_END=428 /DNA_ORIENTATION=+